MTQKYRPILHESEVIFANSGDAADTTSSLLSILPFEKGDGDGMGAGFHDVTSVDTPSFRMNSKRATSAAVNLSTEGCDMDGVVRVTSSPVE